MTLALLLTAVTGAWAVEPTVYNSTVAVSDLNEGDILIEGAQVTLTSDNSYYLNFLQNRFFLNNATTPSISGFIHNTTTVTVGANGLVTGLSYGATARPATESGEEGNAWEVTAVEDKTVSIVGITYDATAEPPITVAWNASTKTGTFSMPGSDVVLTPQYAPAAKWATEGDAVLAPTAIEGVIAGTTDAIVNAGTVVEGQGTVMYAVTSTNQATAPELSAFSATLPTAANIADDGATVYVWYYIKGTDTPDGQEATAENTFNDSEICAQPLEVIVLSNKFDITFNAANANTIESGKATVTVGGTAATVTEGKLEGVKMGSEVKVKANTGYKFRKVEVKKAGPAADIVWDGTNVSDLHVEGNYLSYTKEGIKLSGNAEQVQAEWNNSAYLGTPGMEFITMESGGFTFTAPTGKAFTKIEMKAQGSSGWGSANLGTGWAYNTGTVTWTGSAASTVKLLKDADMFSGDFISSIAFYLSE